MVLSSSGESVDILLYKLGLTVSVLVARTKRKLRKKPISSLEDIRLRNFKRAIGAPSLKEPPVRTCVNCVQKPDASQESLSTVKDLLQSELASLIFASLTPSLPHAASPATFEALNPSVGPTALPSTTFISSLVPTSPSVLPTAIPALEKEPGEFASRSATAAISSFEDESRTHASWPETTTLVSDTPSFEGEEIYRSTRTPVLTSSTTLATHELRMKTKSYTVEPSSISFTNPSTPVWFPREQGALPRNLATLTKQEKEKDMLHFFSRWRSNLKILSPQPARLTFSNTNSLYLKSVRTSVSTNTLPSSSTVSQVIPDRHDTQLADSLAEPKQLLEKQEEARMSLESQQEDASSSVIIGSNSTSFSESNISSYASYSTEPPTRIFPTTDNQISRSAYNLTSNLSSNPEIQPRFLPKTPIEKLQAKFLIRRRTMVSLSVLRANSSSASKPLPMTRTVLRKTSTIHSAVSKYNASVAAGPNKKPLIIRSALQSRQNLVYNAKVPLRLVTTAPYRAVLNASGKSAFFAKMLHRKS